MSKRPKILVIRFSSIGDIVLTTPVLRTLHQQLNAEVHVLTKAGFAGVLADNPHVARIHAMSDGLGPLLPGLRAEKFDAIVDLHHNLRSWRVRLALRRPTCRFDKLNWQKWWLVKFKKDRLPKQHIVDRYLAAAAPLGIQNDGKGLDYFVRQEDVVSGPAWLAEKMEMENAAPYVAVVIGAAHVTKRMPPEKIAEICRQLPEVPKVLLGGPGDQAAGDAIVDLAKTPLIYNACGQLRLGQSASLVQQADCVLTHDTGLMHIAAAFERPIVSVWGNTVPAFGMYPYLREPTTPNHMMELTGLPCRPCSKIGHQACPEGHFRCMKDQSARHIAAKVRSVFAAKTNGNA